MYINDQLTLASKSYSEDVAQRALMSNIPFIGSALDNIFTSKWSKYYQDRLELFQTCVIREFEHIEEKNVKFEFLETPEFFDLIVTLIENSVKTRHSEKVELFSKILRCQVDKTFISKYQPDDYTYIVKEFTPREILVIQAIEKLNKDFKREIENAENPKDVYDFISINKLAPYVDLADNEIRFALSKLSNLGLLDEYYPGNVFGVTNGGDFKVTDSFNELLKIMKS